jgi:hypothetical protein
MSQDRETPGKRPNGRLIFWVWVVPQPRAVERPNRFFGPSTGTLYRQIRQKSDSARPFLASQPPRASRRPGPPEGPVPRDRHVRGQGPPRTPADRPQPPADHGCPHLRGAKWDKSRPPPRFAGGSCVRARWAAHILSTPPIHGGELTFVRAGSGPSDRQPRRRNRTSTTAHDLLLPGVGRSQRPTSLPNSATGGVTPATNPSPRPMEQHMRAF